VLFPGEGVVNSADNNLLRDAVADVSVSVSDGGVPVLTLSGVDESALLEQVKSHCIENPRPGVEEFYPCFGFPG